jgi:histidyl-tRNA synthetase
VVDKLERQPKDVSREKLIKAGVTADAANALLEIMRATSLPELSERFGSSPEVAKYLDDFDRYFRYLQRLGVREWVTLDLTIVRGLAYYTGIVFELFDARGELRAICGGGRYDNLLKALGGTDLPALGFGMGDVVLGELLRARELRAVVAQPDFWVASDADDARGDVMTVATLLRRLGASVEYALRDQTLGKQRKAAFSAGASYFVVLTKDFGDTGTLTVDDLARVEGAGPGIVELTADRPRTLETLLQVVRENPELLISKSG